jgi:hypothetical protein
VFVVAEKTLANDPPFKTFYAPEGDGIQYRSFGVFENLNNGTDKRHSRNLGKTNRIDLFQVV